MTLRWKTLGGLLLVVVLGSTLAIAFRGSPASPPLAAVESSPASQFGSPTRGRIVPLVVDDSGLVPASVSAPAQFTVDAGNSQPLPSLPTIRASDVREPITPPALATEFPRPLNLAEVEAPLPEESFAPIAAPVVAAKPPLPPEPIRHTIVDGDTLPDLAERYLGDRSRAEEIYAENRDVLPSPDLLPLRVEIVISATP